METGDGPFKKLMLKMAADIAQWIHQRLTFGGPWFESQSTLSTLLQFILYL